MTKGQLIKTARKNAGLTQKELGEKLDVAYQTIAQWENDLRNPKQETLKRIADALGISLADLFGVEALFKSTTDKANHELNEWLADMKRQGVAVSESEIDQKWQELLSKGNFIGYAEDFADLTADSTRKRLNHAFDELNDDGQQEAVKRIEELAEIPKYKKAAPKDGDD